MSGSIQRALVILVLPGLLFLSSALVQAEEGDITSLLENVDKRLADANARQQAVEDAEERTLLCKYCHGADGNSLKPDVPNLAGQNARYLLEQINRFATRQRDDYVMSDLASRFSPEDKVNVAIFYSIQAVKPQPVDDDKSAKGQKLYENVCGICHGVEGYGNEKLARVAGQKVVYVTNVLKTFRANANDPAARQKSQRKNEVMEGVVKDLSDDQIDSVANYMASMQ